MKPRVAMLAYACDPEGSGEHWLGWGWAEQAARFCDVQLITTPKSRTAIERHSARLGITPHFVEIPRVLRWLSERLGSAGTWWRKIAWAKRASRLAAHLHRTQPLALVHQTTFHSFRVPFYAASIGVPSVWGPIAGGEHTPPGFDEFLGAAASTERARTRQNRLWLRWPRLQRALREVSILFVSNHTTLDFLPAACRTKSIVVPPNALRPGDLPAAHNDRPDSRTLTLLYVGNCVATRSIPLVLRALARPGLENCTLTVVGKGPALDGWMREATALRLNSQVRFAGQVTRDELPALYAAADALVFPALRDAGGSALIEAMSLGVPVVCLDWAGPGEMVDINSGVKIPVTSPEEAIAGFAAAIARLRDDPAWRKQLAGHAVERVHTHFTWEAKARLLEATYKRLLAQ
jgi:glycosyltransferase involved in cell wall biosynthesis